jgi:hypothetical protein
VTRACALLTSDSNPEELSLNSVEDEKNLISPCESRW